MGGHIYMWCLYNTITALSKPIAFGVLIFADILLRMRLGSEGTSLLFAQGLLSENEPPPH